MSILKHVALQTGLHAGVFRLVQLAQRREALILLFHRLGADGEGDPHGLPVGLFAQYMEYLVRRYRVISLGQLTQELQRGMVRPNTAVVTLDDGYHEVFSLAAPVLRRYDIPASLFVTSDFIEGRLWLWTDHFRFVFERAPSAPVVFRHRGAPYVLAIQDEAARRRAGEEWRERAKRMAVAEREELLAAIAEACGVEIPASPPRQYRPMTWRDLRALAAEGFDVGAHTRTHPILSRLSPEQLQDEIAGCKEQIEQKLGLPVRHFAYPNGLREDYTPQVVEMVSRAGYTAAVTTVGGMNSPATPILELHRIAAPERGLAHFAQSVSGFEVFKERLYRSAGIRGGGLG